MENKLLLLLLLLLLRGEETGEIVGLEMALFHLSQIPLRERNNCDSEAMKMALLNPLASYVVREQLDIQPRDGSVSASHPTWRGNKISSPRHLFVCSVCLSV